MIELTILGSGSSDVRADRGQSGVYVRVDDTRLLFDFGAGTMGRLARAGVSAPEIDGVFVTHGHPDHVTELVTYLFEMKQRVGGTREADIVVHGPPAFRHMLTGMLAVFGQWCVGETYDVVAEELETEPVAVGSATITPHPVQHSIPAVGYRIEDGEGHVVALTGDTGPRDDLVTLAKGADILVADCGLPPGGDYDGHMTPEQAGALAAAAGVRTLVLTHLPPGVEDVDIEAHARAHFDGQVTRAADLLSLIVG